MDQSNGVVRDFRDDCVQCGAEMQALTGQLARTIKVELRSRRQRPAYAVRASCTKPIRLLPTSFASTASKRPKSPLIQVKMYRRAREAHPSPALFRASRDHLFLSNSFLTSLSA